MIKYFVTKDKHSYYKINYESQTIIRICNNKMTFSTPFDMVKEIEALDICSKIRWIETRNIYYRSTYFEWFYNGEAYETCGPDFSEKMLVENTADTPNGMFPIYRYLCFHNGEIWATGHFGNYYPQMPLYRVDVNGKICSKWTNVRNCRNFQKKVNEI